MPEDIIQNFKDQYGDEEGERIYYATANKQNRDLETFKKKEEQYPAMAGLDDFLVGPQSDESPEADMWQDEEEPDVEVDEQLDDFIVGPQSDESPEADMWQDRMNDEMDSIEQLVSTYANVPPESYELYQQNPQQLIDDIIKEASMDNSFLIEAIDAHPDLLVELIPAVVGIDLPDILENGMTPEEYVKKKVFELLRIPSPETRVNMETPVEEGIDDQGIVNSDSVYGETGKVLPHVPRPEHDVLDDEMDIDQEDDGKWRIYLKSYKDSNNSPESNVWWSSDLEFVEGDTVAEVIQKASEVEGMPVQEIVDYFLKIHGQNYPNNPTSKNIVDNLRMTFENPQGVQSADLGYVDPSAELEEENTMSDEEQMDESVLGQHFHNTKGEEMPFPYTQDPLNTASKAEKEVNQESADADSEEREEKAGLKGKTMKENIEKLRIGDVIHKGDDLKTQWVVEKLDESKAYLQSGLKRSVLILGKDKFQFIEGVSLGMERNVEFINDLRDRWMEMEDSVEEYGEVKSIFKESDEHEMNEESDEDKEEGEEEEKPELTKEELFRTIKEGDYHRRPRGIALQMLTSQVSNDLDQIIKVMEDVSIGNPDIDEEYGVGSEIHELDTKFALENAWSQMEANGIDDDYEDMTPSSIQEEEKVDESDEVEEVDEENDSKK